MAKKSVEVDIPHGMTLEQWRRETRGIPGQATIAPHTSKGDRPWESDTHSITLSWEEPARPRGVH